MRTARQCNADMGSTGSADVGTRATPVWVSGNHPPQASGTAAEDEDNDGDHRAPEPGTVGRAAAGGGRHGP